MGKEPQKVTRTERKKAEIRLRLLRVAYKVMSKNNMDDISIAKLAEAADIGFGTFYNYFESIDDLSSQVMACVINDLGRRNDLATVELKSTNPVAVQAISIRLTMREMLTDLMWKWWLNQPELLAEHMRQNFHSYGVRDLKIGIESGRYAISEDEVEAVWSQQMWMLVGGIKTILNQTTDDMDEKHLITIIMRAMGTSPERAIELAEMDLPPFPKPDVDFSIVAEAISIS